MDSFIVPFSQLDNEKFFEAINDQHEFPLNVIDNLSYNPFMESEFTNSVDNYLVRYFKEPKCNYYFFQSSVLCVNFGPNMSLNMVKSSRFYDSS